MIECTFSRAFPCPFQQRQGSATSSSVYNRINSVLRGDIPRNPLSQVSFTQPNIVHHFDPYGAPNASAAPTADTAYVPEYHTPRMAFKSANVDMLMSDIARNGHSTDPFSHTPPHVPATPHGTDPNGISSVPAVPTFCGKPVNPAPVSGSVTRVRVWKSRVIRRVKDVTRQT